MAVIKVNSGDVDLLARLIRAEAEAEGELGMLMVGNVGVNRILSNCLEVMKPCKNRTSTSAPETGKNDWPDVRSTGNGRIPHQTRSGFSARRAIVPPPGIINRILAVIKLTASSYRRDKIVHVFSREQIVKGASSS